MFFRCEEGLRTERPQGESIKIEYLQSLKVWKFESLKFEQFESLKVWKVWKFEDYKHIQK